MLIGDKGKMTTLAEHNDKVRVDVAKTLGVDAAGISTAPAPAAAAPVSMAPAPAAGEVAAAAPETPLPTVGAN